MRPSTLGRGLLALALVAGCSHKTDGPLPTLTAPVQPQAACNEQVPQVVILTGDGLSPLNDHTLLDTSRVEIPQVTLARTTDIEGNVVDSEAASNVIDVPNDLDHPELSDVAWASQQSMSFGVCPPGTCPDAAEPTPPLLSDWPVDRWADKKIPTGLYDLTVTNRPGATDPARDRSFTLPDAFVIVPLPDLQRVDADIVCKDKDGTVTLTGDYFLRVNDQKPNVRLFDDAGFDKTFDASLVTPAECRLLPSPSGMKLESCKKLEVAIPAGWVTFVAETDTYRNLRVEVTGPPPTGCHSTNDVEITFVPKPRLDTVVPDVACDAQGDRALTLSGFGFLTIDGVRPEISFGTALTQAATGATTCTPVGRAGFPRETVESCTTLATTVAQNALPPTDPGAAPADYGVTVANPAPAGCVSTTPINFTVTAPPLVAEVIPDLTCNEQGESTFTLKGAAFVRLGSAAPSVTFTDAAGTGVTVAATLEAASCTVHSGPVEAMEVCTELKAVLPAASLDPGVVQVAVTNPDTAGCVSPTFAMLLVPPPSVASVAPTSLCTAQRNSSLTITGADFLVIDGVAPEVDLVPVAAGATTVVATSVVATESTCTPLTGVKEAAKKCTELVATFAQNSVVVAAEYDVVVVNPPPAGCSSLDATPVLIRGSPPPTLTAVAPPTLCSGGGTLTLTGTNFTPGGTVDIGPLLGQPSLVTSATSARVNVGAGLSPGTYDVTFNNGDGCWATLPNAVTIVPGLMVFFADPPTVWNGIATQITVYGANVSGGIQKVSIVKTGSTDTPTPLAVSNASGNRANALVPKDTPAGTYDLIVEDGSCSAVLPSGLKVVSQTTFAITSLTPTYGSTQTTTGVTIKSNAAFVSTPRAYFSAGAAAATPLSAVTFTDTSTLTAVVPKGLTPGKYDLIVVNPDGGVAVLQQAFTVIQNLTPYIVSVKPDAVPQTGANFTVEGKNFAADATISFLCFQADGTSAGAQFNATGQGNVTACGSNQCIQIAGQSLTGAYCVVRVTNPTDAATFDYSALVIQTPALNMGTFTAATSLTAGRRALGMATAQATPSARFSYVVGGDTGAAATNALATLEAAPVDVYGTLGTWIKLPNPMQTARSFVGVTAVDRFLYAVGGMNSTGALDTLERAYVLNPADAPTWADLDFALPPTGSEGVPGGTFYYRVAAVMLAADPFNPGGENLSSDPLVILAPNLQHGAYITLKWNAVPGAASYRVYRSATPNLAGGSEVLIAQGVTATQFQDTYLSPILSNGATTKPLPMGATGVWHSTGLPTLKSKRAGAAVVAVTDVTTPTRRYLYALGGNTDTEAAPAVVKTTEFVVVDVAANGTQTVTAGGAAPDLATARWQTAGTGGAVSGTNYLWAAGGLTTGGASLNTVDGGAIGSAGVPLGFTQLANKMDGASGRAGLVMTSVLGPASDANQLVVYGGFNAAPDATGRQGFLDVAPQVKNFNGEPNNLRTPRYLMGYTVQSSFLFICGGIAVAGQAPVATCETTRF